MSGTGPATLYLMRHGTPELAGRLLGHTDCAVTAAGIAACAGQATGLVIDRVIASDLRRAADSARAIADDVTTDPRWRELDFGEWDGRAVDELDASALSAFWSDPDANPPPGGERWSALRARVAAAIADIDAPQTLVVTHAGAIRAALAELCGFTYDQLWRIDLPCSVLVTLRTWREDRPIGQITAIRPCVG